MADVSNEEKGVVLEVAHHGIAAAQLRGAAITFVVVADAAVPHHGDNVREDPLGEAEMGGERGDLKLI